MEGDGTHIAARSQLLVRAGVQIKTPARGLAFATGTPCTEMRISVSDIPVADLHLQQDHA